jgi:ATP-dependent DNA helicase RecG
MRAALRLWRSLLTHWVVEHGVAVKSVVALELTRREIRDSLDLRDDDPVRGAYLKPALAAGLIEMTLKDKPRSRAQRYRLTELGLRIKQSRRQS